LPNQGGIRNFLVTDATLNDERKDFSGRDPCQRGREAQGLRHKGLPSSWGREEAKNQSRGTPFPFTGAVAQVRG